MVQGTVKHKPLDWEGKNPAGERIVISLQKVRDASRAQRIAELLRRKEAADARLKELMRESCALHGQLIALGVRHA